MTKEELIALADVLDGIPTDEPRRKAATYLRQCAEQVPVAWRSKELVNKDFVTDWNLTDNEPPNGVRVIAKEALFTNPVPQRAAPVVAHPVPDKAASCDCYQIGGPFIAEDPDCPVHGIGSKP